MSSRSGSGRPVPAPRSAFAFPCLAFLLLIGPGAAGPPRDPPIPRQESPKDQAAKKAEGEAPAASQAKAAPSPGEPAAGAPVVDGISGSFQGPLRFPAEKDAQAPEFLVGSRSIPLEEVIFVRFAFKKAPSQDALVLLRGGDELFAALSGGSETEIRLSAYACRPAKGDGTLAVPLEAVRGIGFPGHFRDAGEGLARIRRWLLSPAHSKAVTESGGEKGAGGEDRVLLTEGAELAGVLQKIDGEAVHFHSGTAGEVRLPLGKVRAVSISEEASAKGEAREEGPQQGSGITVVVQYQDGSALGGRLLSLTPGGAAPGEEAAGAPSPGEIRLLSKALGEVSAPLDRVLELSFRGGRCRYLSDLKPLKVTHKWGLIHPKEIQPDLAASGDPLKIRGRPFKKGLGMYSHCRADYALSGSASRFQAVIGMDDLARPQMQEGIDKGFGTAVFRIYVDDQVKFEKELSWSDPPLPVEIPTEGAKVLGLELDYGRGFLVLAFGDWADARIIKKK